MMYSFKTLRQVTIIFLCSFFSHAQEYSPHSLAPLSGTYAIYWGCFDPPTLAHRDIIVQTIHQREVDGIIVVVNNFKNQPYQADVFNRIKMLEKLLSDNKDKIIYLTQDENHKADYQQIKSRIQGKLYAVVGQDSYEKWAQYTKDFSDYDEIIIVPRFVPSSLNPFTTPLPANISVMKIKPELYQCSSTQARSDLIKDRSSEFLSVDILSYINDKNLYLAEHNKQSKKS